MMTDQLEHVVLDKIRTGNLNGCRYLIDKYHRMVYSMAVQVLKNEQEAEEVTQDTFVQAFRKIEAFRGDSKFSSWLYRIGYNLALTRLRKKRIPLDSLNEDHNEVPDHMEVEDGLEQLQKADRKKYVQVALDALPEHDRLLIMLYYFDELSMAEMESITGIDRNNIKIKIHRARKKMLVELQHQLQAETRVII